uniref:Uncharacterized protein n=1 Tax=Heterorhabditis bacteriophora TaxID=37862 RepID=A0A1I7WWB6_HETBA
MAGHELTNILKHRLVAQMRTMMSPRHVPSAIYAVRDISVCHCFMNTRRDHFLFTNSSKKVELAVRQIINAKEILH